MTLLKSFFCQKGKDNRSRYAVINAIAYISFAAFSIIFSNVSFILIVSLLISVCISSFTTLRRLNDTFLKQKWGFIPAISFLVIGLLIIITQLSIFYWLLFLTAISSFALLTYPSKKHLIYSYGYHGPINIIAGNKSTSYQQRAAHRVEPTIIHNELLSTENFSAQITPAPTQNTEESLLKKEQDIGERIRIYILNNKIFFAVAIVLVIISIISSFLYFQDNHKLSSNQNNELNIKQEISTRLHAITLPDNFSIMLSEFNGVIISWQGDTNKTSPVWSQTSAQGDSSCQSITFNNGDGFRTLSVINEERGVFYANFSPIDTKAILNSVAFRGKFTLCGYSFSLKGSQAVLGKNNVYSELIDY
ncbi:MAG: hypothetical protein ACI9LM_002399 [Alteromonadaceae bacterium]